MRVRFKNYDLTSEFFLQALTLQPTLILLLCLAPFFFSAYIYIILYYFLFDVCCCVRYALSNTRHKFGDRCGGIGKEFDSGETSPIFLQWLDVVHQIWWQFPGEFEFDVGLLVFLVEATYSEWFSNFLCNSEKQRSEFSFDMLSVWDFVEGNRRFSNPLYKPQWPAGVCVPVDHSGGSIVLWRALYQRLSVHDEDPCHRYAQLSVHYQHILDQVEKGEEQLAALRARLVKPGDGDAAAGGGRWQRWRRRWQC